VQRADLQHGDHRLGTAILIVPADGPDEVRPEPVADVEEDEGMPAVICAVLDAASVPLPPRNDDEETL
jgi:hypothetical protein